MRRYLVALSFAAVSSTLAAASMSNRDIVARIERDCGLRRGSIVVVSGDHVTLKPSPGESYKHVDCAIARLNKTGLKLGFVGNEMDPNAIPRPPYRYIAEGPSRDIATLAEAAKLNGWNIIRTALASDGTSFIQFESGPNTTNAEAMKLLDRIWKKEFGDLEFGMAPRKLSDKGDVNN